MPLVYKHEREAGLADKVANDNKIVYASLAELAKPFELNEKTKAVLAKANHKAKAEANPDQPDLYYLKSVLVSVGWNKNDDVFLPETTWAAKSTPRDKPFNYEHNQDDIIGHITDCWVVNEAGDSIASDTDPDDLPEKFHIITPAVIYKNWSEADAQERIDKVIAAIPEGKWFVSMECLFKGFDYALADDGEEMAQSRVVARNKETAYLTKYLRAYGGTGEYQGKRIGRALKNVVFSGKGLVKKPANPDSVIFATGSVKTFSTPITEIDPGSAPAGYESIEHTSRVSAKQESSVMPDTNKTELDLKAENEKLKADLAKAGESKLNEKIEKLTSEAAVAAAKIEEVNKAKAEVEVKLAETDKLVKAAQEAVKVAEEKAKAAEEKLAKIEADAKTAARIAFVVKTLEVDEAKAKTTVAKLATLNDEDFEADIKDRAELVKAKVSKPGKVSGLEAPASVAPKKVATVGKGKGATPPKEAMTTSAALENVEETEEPTLATEESADEGLTKAQADVMKWFGFGDEEAAK
jgi:hypothetical protein